MLKRAGIATVLAAVAGLLGFSGLLQSTAIIVQAFFIVVSAFAFLSLLFSLFEPAATQHGPSVLSIPNSDLGK